MLTTARKLARPFWNLGAQQLARRWPVYSRLFLVSEPHAWSICRDMEALAAIGRRLGVRVAHRRWLRHARQQAVFYGSHFDLLAQPWPEQPHRLATAYFHGQPGSGYPLFDRVYQNLARSHERLHRLQVSHRAMRDTVLETGIAPHKVHLIPIGIDPALFPPQTPHSRRQARLAYGLPQSAVVVGSFQKDGHGWGDGSRPKLIKGPDVFLQTVALLKERVAELFVLLSGPARGYVKAGLERLNVPYRHHYLADYAAVGRLYQALDLYLVTSRQEGGPKAVLESMACGVPLVSTRVGQAVDLVQHGRNGWLAEVENAAELAHWAEYVLAHPGELAPVLAQARQAALANSYERQLGLWREFMRGFVACDG